MEFSPEGGSRVASKPNFLFSPPWFWARGADLAWPAALNNHPSQDPGQTLAWLGVPWFANRQHYPKPVWIFFLQHWGWLGEWGVGRWTTLGCIIGRRWSSPSQHVRFYRLNYFLLIRGIAAFEVLYCSISALERRFWYFSWLTFPIYISLCIAWTHFPHFPHKQWKTRHHDGPKPATWNQGSFPHNLGACIQWVGICLVLGRMAFGGVHPRHEIITIVNCHLGAVSPWINHNARSKCWRWC